MHVFARCNRLDRESDDLVIAPNRRALRDSLSRDFVAGWHHAFDADAFALQLRAGDELHACDDHVVVRVQADRELGGVEHDGD